MGCNADHSSADSSRNGYYEVTFDLGEVLCPTRWEISNNGITIINAEESIQVSNYSLRGDSGSFVMPIFGTTVDFSFSSDSSLSGHFRNQYRPDDYNVPFTGVKTSKPIRSKVVSTSTYDVSVHPKDPYKAIGVFNFEKEIITGTFLTETGDYRFLEGQKTSEDEFYMSCFDGSHLFHFTAKIRDDSIGGKFYSGNHWNTEWSGKLDNTIALAHPDSLTKMNDGKTMVQFGGKNQKGDSLIFNSSDFETVTIVQILGTWCPNCMDETKYYSELAAKYGSGLNIIGLAFETPGETSSQLETIAKYKKEMGISYPVYLSGDASKSEASEMFSELNKIISFPTTIFLDKHGMVRKIHTGFYGPGTGDYYTEYVKNTEEFLDELIGE